MRYKNILPAIPGTTVIWYNAHLDETQEEPVLFWGAQYEDGDPEPFMTPFTLNVEGGFATPLETPGDRAGQESGIIAFNIPGWGRLDDTNSNGSFSPYLRQAKGYVPSLGKNENDAPRETAPAASDPT